MTGWLITAAYAAGYLFTARLMFKTAQENTYRKSKELWASASEKTAIKHAREDVREDGLIDLTMAIVAALFWPIVLLVYGILSTAKDPASMIADEQRMELAALKEQARRLGLPTDGME